jgi:hypothetical protein
MKRSKQGRSVYLEIGIWREPNGSIHMSGKGIPGFHVAINADPKKPNGHPTLFKRFDALLPHSGNKDAAQTALSIVERVTGGKLAK